jgi:hypothetical protein
MRHRKLPAGFFWTLGVAGLLLSPLSCGKSPSDEITGFQNEFKKTYGLDLVYKTFPPASWKVDGHPADPSDQESLCRYLELFRGEFRKYPPFFVAQTRLKTLVFVKGLGYLGQIRGAMPDPQKGTVFYDFKLAAEYPSYQRHTIHHEYFHLIEAMFHGNDYFKDPEWAALNPSSFSYGQGGAAVQDHPEVSLINHPHLGFIDLYAETGLEEDKAEVFATLFIPGEAAQVRQWAQTDPILAAKIDYLEKFIHGVDPEMDGSFWAEIEKQ